jgi:hypothetical protein
MGRINFNFSGTGPAQLSDGEVQADVLRTEIEKIGSVLDQSQWKVNKLAAEPPLFEQTLHLTSAAAAAGASRLRIKAGHRRRKKSG